MWWYAWIESGRFNILLSLMSRVKHLCKDTQKRLTSTILSLYLYYLMNTLHHILRSEGIKGYFYVKIYCFHVKFWNNVNAIGHSQLYSVATSTWLNTNKWSFMVCIYPRNCFVNHKCSYIWSQIYKKK
jgi:hypothetical protein